MRWGLLEAAVQLFALFCGLPFGVMGVAVAYVIAMFVIFIPTIVFAGRPLGIGLADVLHVVWPPLVGTLIAIAVPILLQFSMLAGMERVPRLIVSGLIFGMIYMALVPGLFKLRAPLLLVLKLVHK
jgi:PST family polysaccharide transporter